MSDAITTWKLDPAHTDITFAVKHMMIATVRGRFSGVEGTLTGDPNDLANAKVEVKIDASTIDTRQEQRDDHLRSADFFEVEKFPEITFVSRQVTPKGGDAYEVVGDLTIRGVTQPITLDATFNGRGKDPWGNEKIGFSAEGRLNRKDFGLTWNAPLEAGGFLVSDEVRITIDAQFAGEK